MQPGSGSTSRPGREGRRAACDSRRPCRFPPRTSAEARSAVCRRCSATKAYLTLHPWRSTRPLQDVAFLGDASQLLLQPPDLIGLVTTLCARRGKLLLPLVERVLVNAQQLRNLRNRIASFGDLTHRITFEIVAEIRFAQKGLLPSNLGKKVSTNLGAIQTASS